MPMRRRARFQSFGRLLRVEPLEDRRLLSITVDTLIDEADGSIVDGDISLRDAIALAPAGEMIDFAPALTSGGPATITLTRGQLRVIRSLTIQGSGADLLTIDAQQQSRIFQVFDTDGATLIDVELRGMTLTGGKVVGDFSSGEGGAIRNLEALSVSDCTIRNNSAANGGGISGNGALTIVDSTITENSSTDRGGAIYWRGGTVAVSQTLITDNSASEGGGGIYIAIGAVTGQLSGQLMVTASSILSNSTTGDGGGIFSFDADVTVTNSMIEDNSASGTAFSSGGGIANIFGNTVMTGTTVSLNTAGFRGGGVFGATGAVTVMNSSIDGNSAQFSGGGIDAVSMTVFGSSISENSTHGIGGGGIRGSGVISSSTVSGNSANGGGGGGGMRGVFSISNSTITNNVASSFGAGIEGSFIMDHSILAGNKTSNGIPYDIAGSLVMSFSLLGANYPPGAATITDNGGNLIGTIDSPIDPKLAPLTDNGGPTLTHALLPNSPAIDAGNPSFVPPPSNDQRGAPYSRVYDGDGLDGARIDIGAFELQPPPALVGDYNGDGSVNAADYTVWRDTLGSTTDLRANGDDSNSIIDAADYGVWTANFGETLGAGGTASQPSALPGDRGTDTPARPSSHHANHGGQECPPHASARMLALLDLLDTVPHKEDSEFDAFNVKRESSDERDAAFVALGDEVAASVLAPM